MPNPEVEAACDKAAMQLLDQLLAGHNPDEVLEECDDNDLVDTEADVWDMDAVLYHAPQIPAGIQSFQWNGTRICRHCMKSTGMK